MAQGAARGGRDIEYSLWMAIVSWQAEWTGYLVHHFDNRTFASADHTLELSDAVNATPNVGRDASSSSRTRLSKPSRPQGVVRATSFWAATHPPVSLPKYSYPRGYR